MVSVFTNKIKKLIREFGGWVVGREGRLVCRFDISLPSAREDSVGGYGVLVDILRCVVELPTEAQVYIAYCC